MIKSRYVILAALAVAAPAFAQQPVIQAGVARESNEAIADTLPTKTSASRLPRYITPASQIQYMRNADQRGVNVFESPKEAGAEFTGFKLSWGGAFTQQYQNLTHRNAAAPKLVTGSTVNQNQLIAPYVHDTDKAIASDGSHRATIRVVDCILSSWRM